MFLARKSNKPYCKDSGFRVSALGMLGVGFGVKCRVSGALDPRLEDLVYSVGLNST